MIVRLDPRTGKFVLSVSNQSPVRWEVSSLSNLSGTETGFLDSSRCEAGKTDH